MVEMPKKKMVKWMRQGGGHGGQGGRGGRVCLRLAGVSCGVGGGWAGLGAGLGWAESRGWAGAEKKRQPREVGWSGCGGGLSARGWAGLVGWGLGCAGGWAGVAGLGAGMGEIEVLGLKA